MNPMSRLTKNGKCDVISDQFCGVELIYGPNIIIGFCDFQAPYEVHKIISSGYSEIKNTIGSIVTYDISFSANCADGIKSISGVNNVILGTVTSKTLFDDIQPPYEH